MDIMYDAMFYLLNLFKQLFDRMGAGGGYGFAIIALTVALRLVLWPMNTAQTRSMKKMQELQPKIKALQEKYQDNPQKMQEQLLKFYADNKFNPLAGCLPMLVQLPIFIGLYGMLISPDFLAVGGNESFLFIEHLAQPLTSHAGETMDGVFHITEKDRFLTQRHVNVILKNGKTVQYRVRDPRKVLMIEPTPMIPGEPLVVSLDTRLLSEDRFTDNFVEEKIAQADLVLVNESTKELEHLSFKPAKRGKINDADPSSPRWTLTTRVETAQGKQGIHPGVLYLILIYTAVTFLYQKVMTPSQVPSPSGPQGQLMKFLPFIFVGFLVFIPIPAGVILYLVVTMLLMFIQTAWVRFTDDRQSDKHGKPPGNQVVDVKPNNGP